MAEKKRRSSTRMYREGAKNRHWGGGGAYGEIIDSNKGVVIYKSEEKLDGYYFVSFIERTLIIRLLLQRLRVQDGDPRRNSEMARAAMERAHCHLVTISPRGPELNPIDNIF